MVQGSLENPVRVKYRYRKNSQVINKHSLENINNCYMIRNIIFAEDDEDDQFYFREVFQEINKNIQLQFVSNGNELMQMLQNFLPDMVFLDLEMPYKNGLECLVELRNNPSLNKLPVIVLSSTVRPVNIQTAYEMGASLFLHKSSTDSDYAESLKKIMSMDWNDPEEIRGKYFENNQFRSFN
jgi:CheY-like chemotaxis protein